MKLKWPKDRKRAFLWAAEAFGTPEDLRTKRQKELTKTGFCRTISNLTGTEDTVDIEDICTWSKKFFGKYEYWWQSRFTLGTLNNAWTPDCDKERSLFCYLMADLSDKEFEELST